MYSQEFTKPEEASKFVHCHFQLNDNRGIVWLGVTYVGKEPECSVDFMPSFRQCSPCSNNKVTVTYWENGICVCHTAEEADSGVLKSMENLVSHWDANSL